MTKYIVGKLYFWIRLIAKQSRQFQKLLHDTSKKDRRRFRSFFEVFHNIIFLKGDTTYKAH